MAAIKFLLFVCLAFSAGHARAASTGAEPKAFYVYSILEKVSEIAKAVVDSLQSDIDTIEPIMDELMALLPADTVANVQEMADWVKQAIIDEDKQWKLILELFEKAFEDLKPVDSCTAPEDANIKKAVDTLVSAINKGIQDAIENNQEDVDNVKARLLEDLIAFRKFYNEHLPGTVACLKPGNQDSCSCLEKAGNDVASEITILIGGFITHLIEFNEVIVKTVGLEAIAGISPAIPEYLENVKGPIGNVCKCTSKLS